MNDSSEVTPTAKSSNGPEPHNTIEGIAKQVDAVQSSQEGLNPYQPEDLWIDLDKLHAAAAVNRPITTIPSRKPNKHEFFRTHRGEKYWHPMAFVEFERVLYPVHPDMVRHFDAGDIFYAIPVLCISKSGQLFLWPLKVSNQGRANTWNDSALAIAKQATEKWVKIRSRLEDGKGQGYYQEEVPLGVFDEPVWPNLTPKQVLDIAFKGGLIIDKVDHLVIQKITGQIK
jgi:hypothetical protein